MAAKAKKGRTLAVVDLADDEETTEKEADPAKGIPLFEGLGDEVKIEVYRMEPVEEGTIGTLAPDADEATIARRWGGGVYRVTAKGTDGKFSRRQRTVTIGGDPRFGSKDATRKYKILMGEIPDDNAAKSAAPAAPALDVSGLLSIIQASHQNSMSFMQAQLAAQQQQQQQAILAAAKMADERAQRDREFFATMLQLQKAEQKQTEPLAMIPVMVKMLELGKNMAGGGGGETDPVTAFIQGLPVILPQAKELLSMGGQGAANQQQPPPAAPPAPGQQPQGPRIVVTGELAEQLAKTHADLVAKGYDADKALSMAMQQLSVQVPPKKPGDPKTAEPGDKPSPQPAEPPAPAAAAGNGTAPRTRATRRK